MGFQITQGFESWNTPQLLIRHMEQLDRILVHLCEPGPDVIDRPIDLQGQRMLEGCCARRHDDASHMEQEVIDIVVGGVGKHVLQSSGLCLLLEHTLIEDGKVGDLGNRGIAWLGGCSWRYPLHIGLRTFSIQVVQYVDQLLANKMHLLRC